MSTAQRTPGILPPNLSVDYFVREDHFYLVARLPLASVYYGIWGSIGSARPSAFRGDARPQRVFKRLNDDGYRPAKPAPELDPTLALGSRNLERIFYEVHLRNGETTEVDLELPAVPTTSATTPHARVVYDRAKLISLIDAAGETFTRRMKKNQTDRDSEPARPTLSRFINPPILERLRPISRSTDSSWGNVIGDLATQMATLRFGDSAPLIYRGRFVTVADVLPAPTHKQKQSIAHRVDITTVEAEIARLLTKDHETRKIVRDQAAYDRLQKNPPRAKSGQIVLTDVDLIYRDDHDKLRVFEMKASGQLDVKNGLANARALLVRAILAGDDAEPFYSSIQRESSGTTTERDLPGKSLGGSAFWSALLPHGVDYAEFEQLLDKTLAPYRAELTAWLEQRDL